MTVRKRKKPEMAGVTDLEFRQMKKFMGDYCFTCTDEWLLACMNWIKQENHGSVSVEVWKRELKDQWKDANLEEMESACLPKNLASQKLVKLPGKYGLQVNSFRDIGESSYSQWTKLKKLENENTTVAATDSTQYTPSWQPTPKRCLHLTMTDGNQQVFGMEMQFIPELSLNLKPGCKVIVSGPVNCRRGVIHLKQNNVRVIGGEVEDLLEANNVEKILADTLKIKYVPSKQSQQSATRQTAAVEQRPNSSRVRNNMASVSSSGTEEVVGDFPDSEGAFPDIGADDDIFMEIDEEALLQSAGSSSTRAISQMTTQKIQNNSNSTITAFTEDIEDFEDVSTARNNSTAESFSSSSKSSRNISSIQAPSKSSTSSSSTALSTRKPKPVFVPPLAKPADNRPTTSSSSSTQSLDSSKPKTTVGSTAFKTAKTALNQNGSATGAKQLNILQYMRPMPVVIDPPTPERQVKRRRKSEEQSHFTVSQHKKSEPTIKEEPNCEVVENINGSAYGHTDPPFLNDDEDDDRVSITDNPDESLMRIVDETLESKLLENSGQEPSIESTSLTSVTAKTFPVTVSESPFVFLAQVKDRIEDLMQIRKTVSVKACVSTIVSNIQVDNGCWTLCVCINDGTDYLDCKICTNILNEIIGFTPSEMKKIKATKSREGKQQIAKGMGNLAKKLVHLNAIFVIEISDQPMITDIIDLRLNHSAALKSRLFQLGL